MLANRKDLTGAVDESQDRVNNELLGRMSENLDKKLAELQETIDGDCDFVGRVKRNGQTMHSEEVIVDFMQMASRL